MPESPLERGKRHRQRALFDTVASLYDASRPHCPSDVVDALARTVALCERSRVLEVGCGTGQLTGQLAARGVELTAIDIGPSMVATARARVGVGSVHFLVTSFEVLAADDASFDLIVSADAFHWLDPEIRFSKSARLLRPGGWLAVLSLMQAYDEPLHSALTHMWVTRSGDSGGWLRQPSPTMAETMVASGLFGPPVELSMSDRRRLPATAVVDLECTRATSLDWNGAARQAFADELWSHLPAGWVEFTQVATITMAQVAAHAHAHAHAQAVGGLWQAGRRCSPLRSSTPPRGGRSGCTGWRRRSG